MDMMEEIDEHELRKSLWKYINNCPNISLNQHSKAIGISDVTLTNFVKMKREPSYHILIKIKNYLDTIKG